MMISERLVTINAPFGYSLLLEGMEKALLSLPIGFLHLGNATISQVIMNVKAWMV